MFSSYPNNDNTLHLSREHRHMLEEESGIDPGVADERGYQTIRKRADLLDFKKYQRRVPALRAPMYSPDDETTAAQIRPATPRKGKNGKPIKYETAAGSEVILDVHPRMRTEVNSGDGDLWITEGIKKADALTSRGLPTIGIIGVWNWQRGGELLPCWRHVRLEGRRVCIVYDADVMVNPNVQLALQRLVEELEAHGADVLVVYLPDLGDGKTGVDDYLAAGRTVAELKMLARTFEPDDIGNVRMAADAGLRDAIDNAWRSWWAQDWNRVTGTGENASSKRGHTARDVEKAAIERATKSGVVTEEGIYFTFDVRSWSLAAAKSRPSVIKAIKNLEAEGRIKRSEIEREEGRAAGYILLTARDILYQYGQREPREGRVDSLRNVTSDRSGKGCRAPSPDRLRWSVNQQPARRGLIKNTRKPREYRFPARDGIKRLGPNRGAIVDALEALGGSATLQDLADALHKPRARDLARRPTTPKGRDGLLVMLEDAGIVELDGDTVSLTEDWQTALYNARVLAHEADGRDGAETRDQGRHKREREAFRNRHKVTESPHWTNHSEADGAIEDVKYLGPLPNQWDLYKWLDKRVQTDRGPGKLWQILGGEARVILDSNPERWTPLDPAEIRAEAAA